MEINNNKNLKINNLSQSQASLFQNSQKTYINSIFKQYDSNGDGVITLDDKTTDDPSLLGKTFNSFSQKYASKEETEGNTITDESIITDPNTSDFLSQMSIKKDKDTAKILQTKTTTPSEISGYSDFQIKNAQGKVTDSVKFTKDENGQHENVDIATSDGGKFTKSITNNGNKKFMQCTITDKNGNTLYHVSKEYENDGKTAKVKVNDKTYIAEGLNTNNLTLTSPDGTKQTVDLNKYCSKHVQEKWDDEKGKFVEIEESATSEEQENLKINFKKLAPDAMISLVNNAKGLGYQTFYSPRGDAMNNKDGTYNAEKDAVLVSKNTDTNLILHELGHAIDRCDDSNDKKSSIYSSNSNFKELFQKANSGKYQTETTKDEKKYSSHVTDTPEELFADSYAIMQNIDLKQPDVRHLVLMKYFSPAMAKANTFIK